MHRFYNKPLTQNSKKLELTIKKEAEPLDESSKITLELLVAITNIQLNIPLCTGKKREEDILNDFYVAVIKRLPSLLGKVSNCRVVNNVDKEVKKEERAIQKMVEEFNLRHPGFCEPFDLTWDENKKIQFSQNFLGKWASEWFNGLPEKKDFIKTMENLHSSGRADWNETIESMLTDFLESIRGNGVVLSQEKSDLFMQHFKDAVESGSNPFGMKF